ncbi:DUF742 domain-containing protein [Streptomyces sp. NPDC088387]|uniref:DUF742 domain-containing protein n=1 Tax=Streptomyces sp. NPDC088387 TaxID=3365859 RepID=UPI00381F215D
MNTGPGPHTPPQTEAELASIVRLYAVTDGRTRARHHLSMHTVLGAGRRCPPGLPEESVRIVELCRLRARPLVELAGLLRLHVTVVTVLVSDLIDAGALTLPVPEMPGEEHERQKLFALAAALKRRYPGAAAKAG